VSALGVLSGRKWSRSSITLVIAGALPLLAYLGITAMLYLLQDKFIFPASRVVNRDPSYFDWSFEDVWLEPSPGERSHAWWIPTENSRGVCLFSHGNGGNIAGRLESVGALRKLGLSVLVYDYGGYGKSSGAPSEGRIYDDIRAAWRYLTETRGIAPQQIVLFGRSLGGAPSAQLATEVSCAGLVLESTFTSLPAAAQEAMPWVPARWLTRHHFDSLSKMPSIHCPVLVIHAPEDRTVRFHHGEALYAAANQPKRWLQIHGDHNAGFLQSQDLIHEAWSSFLQAYLPAR